jgi:iduronate 2-sulfatase
MSFLRFLATAALMSLLPAVAWPAPSPRNIVLLAVDGLDFTQTPAVLALRRRSRVFERAYWPHPLSGVSRAALFLGRRPEQTGLWTEADHRPEESTLLSEAFARAGYATARVGRTVGGALEARSPWDRTLSFSPSADTGQQVATLLAEPRAKPLFVAASFDDLGGTVIVAQAGKGPAGAAHPAIAYADLPFAARPGQRHPATQPTDEAVREAHRLQDERTRRFDAQLARIVATLDQRQLWDSTVVVLVGLQAPALGDQGVLSRFDVLFEESLHAPLLVAVPGLPKPGDATRAVVDVTDLYPTLLELAGVAPMPPTDGRSLARQLRDPEAPGRAAVASVARRNAGHLGRSVRTTRWRFTEWPDGSHELYDHQADPHEYTNLAARPEQAATVAAMKALVRAHEPRSERAAGAAPVPPAGRRPNVLFILADDANMHLGTYGYPVQTPNIDRLARLGRRFEHAYVQVPSCNPSRTSLLSGWQPERTDVWDNIRRPTPPGMHPLEDEFAASGYFTAEIGKIWETRFAKFFKWDVSEYFPALPAGTPTSPPNAQRDKKEEGGRDPTNLASFWRKTDNPDQDEADGRRARRVAQLISETRDRPFFIALGFGKPHLRWSVPRRYFDLYDPATIHLPPNPPDDSTDIPEIAIDDHVSRAGRFYLGREDNTPADLQRQAIAAYYATVSFVDAQLGVVLEAMDRQKLWDDTIVVFASDNGYHLGEHRSDMWRKDTLFEEGVHVPLIMTAPGLANPGVAAPAPVELLDLYPTLVELAGLPSVPGLDGRSLAPILRDPAAEVRSAARSWRRVDPPELGVSIRSGKWRYTEWPDGSEELFDLDRDPAQRQDLAGRAENAAIQADLRVRSRELVP